VPGVNPHAKGFYRENLEAQQQMTVRMIEETEVLSSIFESRIVCSPEVPMNSIPAAAGKPGDWRLVYTENGFFFVFFVVPPGSAIPQKIAVFDATGKNVESEETIEYLRGLDSELLTLEILKPELRSNPKSPVDAGDPEEIVEVRGSSSCFEYQFPASPEFFVGRGEVLDQVDVLVREILERKTSARGILFEGNSGLGKSSAVLSAVSRLNASGNFAISIDCRSASSPHFALRVVNHVLTRYDEVKTLPNRGEGSEVLGLDSASSLLIQLGDKLREHNLILFIFFDQFENLFFLPEVLRPIRDLFLKVGDAQTNVVLGFSWKTDLFGLTSEFPYLMRDAISNASRHIPLETFSELETSEMLQRLSQEIRSKLRKDLIFFLSEFSQGYPWLLKKLCAHVKLQREAGVQQAEIAGGLLNVEQLFQDDLHGLSPEEEESLRRIAKSAPISISDYGEDVKPAVLQSLINARLIIRVGTKIDVYWDIFKDYLNSGKVPVQDNYILRIQVGSVLKAAKLLNEVGPTIDVAGFRARAVLTEKSFYNIMKDMRLLGLARLEDGKVQLQLPHIEEQDAFELALRSHVKERIRRNRLVRTLIDILEAESELPISGVASALAKACPYVIAGDETWRTYARVFADWMDFADVAVFEPKTGTLQRYRPGTEVRQRAISSRAHRSSVSSMPLIQFSPVFDMCLRVANAFVAGSRIDMAGIKPSTATKALATLEDLGFIIRKTGSLVITPKMSQFVRQPDHRNQLFADAALGLEVFSAFIAILQDSGTSKLSLLHLGRIVNERFGYNWRDGTAETAAKILLDWARHTGLAPETFARAKRGRFVSAPNQSELSFS
jgi:Holliday junction resolvasome RuvABC ATP-dependent DNA helicase subunit